MSSTVLATPFGDLYPVFSSNAELEKVMADYQAAAKAFYDRFDAKTKAQLMLPQELQVRTQIGGILLTLSGAKPCVLINPHYGASVGPLKLATKMAREVLMPLFGSHPRIELAQINEGLPLFEAGADHSTGWLLLNKGHPQADFARTVFGIAGNAQANCVVRKTDIGRALGYPVEKEDYDCSVEYMSGGNDADFVLEYNAHMRRDGPAFVRQFCLARLVRHEQPILFFVVFVCLFFLFYFFYSRLFMCRRALQCFH
jgi:hypothetical protein